MNENAVTTLEKELEDTVKELISEAQIYANYAGRRNTITRSDVAFAHRSDGHPVRNRSVLMENMPAKRVIRRRRRLSNYEISRGFPLATARRML